MDGREELHRGPELSSEHAFSHTRRCIGTQSASLRLSGEILKVRRESLKGRGAKSQRQESLVPLPKDAA
jgi:hypothetical protein